MKRYMTQILLVASSFLLGIPLNVNANEKQSMNGCSTKIFTNIDYFYDEVKNSIDVIALGDSNIYRGFSPMLYWKDTNIPAFTLASATQPAWLSYYQLEDALKYQQPKVILFEINQLFANHSGKIFRSCSAINTFHSDSAILHAIADETSGFEEEDREILYENYANKVYKETIKQPLSLQSTTKRKEKFNFKGYMMNMGVIPLLDTHYMSRKELNLSVDQINATYIDKIIQLCKKHNITLLFVKYPTVEWSFDKSELASQFAKERNIPFLDLNVEDIGIDWNKDSKDAGFHMNEYGVEKCMKKVEAFINTHVKLIATSDEAITRAYQASLQRYEQAKKEGKSKDIQ